MIEPSLFDAAHRAIELEKEADLLGAAKGIGSGIVSGAKSLRGMLGAGATSAAAKAKGVIDAAKAQAPAVAQRAGELAGAGVERARALGGQARELGGKALDATVDFANKRPVTTAVAGGGVGALGAAGAYNALSGGGEEAAPAAEPAAVNMAPAPAPNATESNSGLSGAMGQLNAYLGKMNPAARNALIGGAGGALAGGLYGLVAPGEETVYDDMGRPTGTRRKNRLMSALRNAAVVGGLGAGAGGLYGAYRG